MVFGVFGVVCVVVFGFVAAVFANAVVGGVVVATSVGAFVGVVVAAVVAVVFVVVAAVAVFHAPVLDGAVVVVEIVGGHR